MLRDPLERVPVLVCVLKLAVVEEEEAVFPELADKGYLIGIAVRHLLKISTASLLTNQQQHTLISYI